MSVTTRATLLASLALYCTVPAWSITAEDVMDKMSAAERNAYLSATIETMAFLSSVQGKQDRADCIMRWYFREESKKAAAQVVSALDRFKDRQVLPVIYAVVKRACGE